MHSFITPPRATPLPRVDRAHGVYIWDHDGKRYLDGSSGAVCCTLGYGNERVISAATSQLKRIAFGYSRTWQNDSESILVQRLAQQAGFGLDSAFFVSGGSEAVEACLKFARQVALARGQIARWKVISRMPSYHGSTLGALSVTGDDAFCAPFQPMIVTHPKVPAPLSYRVPEGFSVESYAAHCAQSLEKRIQAEGPETVLAFILEPIGGTSTGALVAPPEYYEQVRAICDRHGVLLIYDEIMSCAGRAGRFLAAQYWSTCRPDIVALAKGLSSGYAPIGALLTSAALVEEVKTAGGFLHGHTYAANALSCAVSCAVIDELLESKLIENSAHMGEVLRAGLEALKAREPLIGDVRGRGLHLAVEIVADPVTKAQLPAESRGVEGLRDCCMRHGLALLTRRTSGGRFGEWLMVAPPLIVTREQVQELIRSFSDGLREFRETLHRAGQVQLA